MKLFKRKIVRIGKSAGLECANTLFSLFCLVWAAGAIIVEIYVMKLGLFDLGFHLITWLITCFNGAPAAKVIFYGLGILSLFFFWCVELLPVGYLNDIWDPKYQTKKYELYEDQEYEEAEHRAERERMWSERIYEAKYGKRPENPGYQYSGQNSSESSQANAGMGKSREQELQSAIIMFRLHEGFTKAELKKARNDLLKSYHSDNTHQAADDEKVKEINQKYEMLQEIAA